MKLDRNSVFPPLVQAHHPGQDLLTEHVHRFHHLSSAESQDHWNHCSARCGSQSLFSQVWISITVQPGVDLNRCSARCGSRFHPCCILTILVHLDLWYALYSLLEPQVHAPLSCCASSPSFITFAFLLVRMSHISCLK